ncbi:MAG: hypothetical protein ABI923_02620 [bacterium]
METDTQNIKVRVQETLGELFNERLLPFELTAYHVNAEGAGEYVVLFYDSRIHSIKFSSKDDGRLKEVVRAAVLDRVDKMSGPLKAGLCINRNRAERSIGIFAVGKKSGEVTSGVALALSGGPF